MRVRWLLAALACLPLLLALEALEEERNTLSSLAVPLHERMLRPRADTLDICANVGIVIPGISVLPSITLAVTCLCLDNGLLTGASTTRLASLTTGAVNTLLSALGRSLSSIAIAQLKGMSTSCVYPANALPDSCTDCSFSCDPNYKKCNGQCVPTAQTCATGGTPRRKRDAQKLREDLRCQKGFIACLVPHAGSSLRLDRKAYDCVDPKTDLESCGGCTYPQHNQTQAVDCTELAASASVSCINARCVIDSCLRGFVLLDGMCMPMTGRRSVNTRTVWSAKD